MSSIDSNGFTVKVIDVLERMAFVLAEPSEEENQSILDDSMMASRIVISRDGASNHVLLAGSQGFLTELCASMLGAEPEEVDLAEHGHFGIMELANVVGGEVVMALGGEDRMFTLGLPESIDCQEVADALEGVRGDSESFTAAVDTEEGHLLVVGFTGGLVET